MRLVICNEENGKMSVGKDGMFYQDLNGSSLDDSIHAVQWNGQSGEIERKDPATGRIISNDPITDITPYQFAVDAWQQAYDAEQAAIAAALAEQQAAEQEQQPE